MLKDLRLAKDAAGTAGVAALLGNQAAQIYETFVQKERGAIDFSGVIERIREQSRGK
jgi:3-hydroxyisobutyrate dehydrogenase